MVLDPEVCCADHEAVTTAHRYGRHWPRRHPFVLFWVLTAPSVLQLTYVLMDPTSVIGSTIAVWVTYLLVQFCYALLLVGLVRLRRRYWDWVDRI
jgi:Na+/melibiose symporter-like transporter